MGMPILHGPLAKTGSRASEHISDLTFPEGFYLTIPLEHANDIFGGKSVRKSPVRDLGRGFFLYILVFARLSDRPKEVKTFYS